jgi:hypothetical protein
MTQSSRESGMTRSLPSVSYSAFTSISRSNLSSSSSTSSSSQGVQRLYSFPTTQSSRESGMTRSLPSTIAQRRTQRLIDKINWSAASAAKDHFGIEADSSSDEEREAAIPVCLISLQEHMRRFDRRIPDVKQGRYQICRADRPIYTSGVATCIALIALGFNSDGYHVKTGVAHYDGIEPNLTHFFKKITTSPVKEVSVYAYGGHDKGLNDEDENWAEVLKVIDTFESVHVADWVMNPWSVQESYEETEPRLHNVGIHAFGLRVGIKDNKIFVCDESTGVKASSEAEPTFVDYEEILELGKRLESKSKAVKWR